MLSMLSKVSCQRRRNRNILVSGRREKMAAGYQLPEKSCGLPAFQTALVL
jgi:hypothetical protein